MQPSHVITDERTHQRMIASPPIFSIRWKENLIHYYHSLAMLSDFPLGSSLIGSQIWKIWVATWRRLDQRLFNQAFSSTTSQKEQKAFPFRFRANEGRRIKSKCAIMNLKFSSVCEELVKLDFPEDSLPSLLDFFSFFRCRCWMTSLFVCLHCERKNGAKIEWRKLKCNLTSLVERVGGRSRTLKEFPNVFKFKSHKNLSRKPFAPQQTTLRESRRLQRFNYANASFDGGRRS